MPKGYTKVFKFEILSDEIAVDSAFIISNSVQQQWQKNNDDGNICCINGNNATLSQVMQTMAMMITMIMIVRMVAMMGNDGRIDEDSNCGEDDCKRR